MRVLAVLSLSFLSLGCSMLDRAVLGTNQDRVNPGRAVRHVIQVDGHRVELWTARSPGAMGREPEGFVLLFTGKEDRADRWTVPVADVWGGLPVEVWGMNYPGCGGSEGPPLLARVMPDALHAYDEVAHHAGGRPIFVQSASFGSGIPIIDQQSSFSSPSRHSAPHPNPLP